MIIIPVSNAPVTPEMAKTMAAMYIILTAIWVICCAYRFIYMILNRREMYGSLLDWYIWDNDNFATFNIIMSFIHCFLILLYFSEKLSKYI